MNEIVIENKATNISDNEKIKAKSKPKIMTGTVTYHNASRGVIGFKANGVGYQCATEKEFAVKDKIRFVIIENKIELK